MSMEMTSLATRNVTPLVLQRQIKTNGWSKTQPANSTSDLQLFSFVLLNIPSWYLEWDSVAGDNTVTSCGSQRCPLLPFLEGDT